MELTESEIFVRTLSRIGGSTTTKVPLDPPPLILPNTLLPVPVQRTLLSDNIKYDGNQTILDLLNEVGKIDSSDYNACMIQKAMKQYLSIYLQSFTLLSAQKRQILCS